MSHHNTPDPDLLTHLRAGHDAGRGNPNALMDRVVEALRLLGCTGPAHGEDILAAAGTHLSVRERAYVLDQLDPNLGEPVHGAYPATLARPWTDGATDTCSVCGRPIRFYDHSPNGQGGWSHTDGES